MTTLFRALAFASLLILHGCAPEGSRQMTAVEEAYRLMDQGDNAKAALVLEQELEARPENSEARELLGSAYVGLAGVDIYAIYETFHDVLFKKSLISQLENKGTAPSAPIPATAAATVPEPASNAVDSVTAAAASAEVELERTLRNLDQAIIDAQKIASYLSRFPQVPKAKWIYLEKALYELRDFKSTSDIALYRVLIRLIYVKSYLVEEEFRDERFGSKKWACSVDTNNLKDRFQFVGENLRYMQEDVVLAVKNGAKKLANAESMFAEIVESTSIAETAVLLKNSPSLQRMEAQLRNRLGCPYTR